MYTKGVWRRMQPWQRQMRHLIVRQITPRQLSQHATWLTPCPRHLLCFPTVVCEIAQILHCGLDRQTVQILMALCEHGVNPEALAAVVRELRRESASLRVQKCWCCTPPPMCKLRR